MKFDKLYSMLDTLEEKYIAVWQDICNIESPTDFKAGVDAVSNYIINIAKPYGYDIDICEQKISGNAVCITMNPTLQNEPICLSGHMDTVHKVGAFGSPAVKTDKEKIYGPGVLDCKGGIAAALYAMETLVKCGFNKRPIMLLLQSDEETGSRYSNKETINYICDKAKNAIAFFNLEGNIEPKYCAIQRKGIINYKFTVTGIEAHSSQCANRGASAIHDAAYKIIELEKIKDDEGLTCNCGVISGGSVPNTIAGKCEFTANVRFATNEQYQWVDDYVNKLAATVHVKGCTCAVEKTSTRLAMEYCERNVQLLKKMNEIFEQNGIPTMIGAKRNGGSDAAEVTSAGIPCIDGLGCRGGEIHSLNEFAYINSLKAAAKRLVALIWNM